MPTTTTGVATTSIDFTRASNATVTDSDGRVKWAPHNLLLNSESFDAAAWQATSMSAFGSGSVANATAAPNGTTTADLRVPANASSTHTIWQPAVTSVNGVSYTTVLFVKPSGYTKLAIVENEITGYYVSYDATGSGSVLDQSNATGTITPLSDGWYQITHVSAAGGTSYRPQIFFLPASYTTGTYTSSWTPNGTSGMYLWGAACYRSDLAMQPNTSAYPLYNPTTPKNLLGYTQDFNNAYWLKYAVAVPATKYADPFGGTTANLLYPTAATTDAALYKGGFPSVSKTHSYYVKSAGKSWVCILKEGTTGGAAWFNISTGSVGTVAAGYTAPTPASLGNGWYRCSVTSTSGFSQYTAISAVDADNSTTPTPNGTDGIYIWGAQLSDSASLDSYSPVYGAAVTSAAYYGPRRDFDGATLACKGLLVEEQRVNLLLYSAQFDVSANWVPSAGVSISANSTISPDGTLTADTMNSSAGHQIDQSISCSTSTVYTDSLYFKKTSGSAYQPALYLLFSGGTLVIYAVRLNTDTGVATAVSAGGFTAPSGFAVQDVGGYWRLSVTGNSNNNTTVSFRLYPNLTVSGGVGGAGSQIIWGAQLDSVSGGNAPFATSYIPTGAATATRNADVASVSTQAFPYSATEGTIVVNYDRVGITQYSRLFTLADAAGQNQVSVLNFNAGQENPYFVQSGAGTTVTGPSLPAVNAVAKMGFAFKTGDSAYSLNGATATANATSFTLSATGLQLGHVIASGQYLNGHIRQITYLPRRISNAELVTRST